MRVEAKDLSWGKYGGFEGPYWRGTVKLVKPAPGAPFWERVMWVVTQTEGGAYDAINNYDQCIFSPGLIQLCEIFGIATKMLRKFAGANGKAFDRFTREMPGNVDWNFKVDGLVYNKQPVKIPGPSMRSALRRFYLGGSSGKLGEWTDAQKAHARQVCAAMASMHGDPAFLQLQLDHVSPLLRRFVIPEGLTSVFPEAPKAGDTGYRAAMQCAYLSFAGNLPQPAWETLREVMKTWDPGMTDEDRCLSMLAAMVGRGVGIWPHRYNVIRPHLEEQFGVDLPDLAVQLKDAIPVGPTVVTLYPTVKLWQVALLTLGGDLGPAGADGVAGEKTKRALQRFEVAAGVRFPDGIYDATTAKLLHCAVEEHDAAVSRKLQEVSRDAWACIFEDDGGALEVLMTPLSVEAG